MVAAAACADGRAAFGIGENQVQIGRNVQFAAACLAHGDDAQVLLFTAVLPDGGAVARPIIVLGEGGCGVGGKIGKAGDGVCHFGQIGHAAEVARHDVRQNVAAQDAQLAGEFGFVFFGTDALPIGEVGKVLRRERARQRGGKGVGADCATVQLAGEPEGMAAGGIQIGDGHGFRLPERWLRRGF